MTVHGSIEADACHPVPIRSAQHIDRAAVAGCDVDQVAVRRVGHAGIEFNPRDAQKTARNLRHRTIRSSRAIDHVQRKGKSHRRRNQLLSIGTKRQCKWKWRYRYPIANGRNLPSIRNCSGQCLTKRGSRDKPNRDQQ